MSGDESIGGLALQLAETDMFTWNHKREGKMPCQFQSKLLSPYSSASYLDDAALCLHPSCFWIFL